MRVQDRAGGEIQGRLEVGVSISKTAACSDFIEIHPEEELGYRSPGQNPGKDQPLSLCNFTFVKLMQLL